METMYLNEIQMIDNTYADIGYHLSCKTFRNDAWVAHEESLFYDTRHELCQGLTHYYRILFSIKSYYSTEGHALHKRDFVIKLMLKICIQTHYL